MPLNSLILVVDESDMVTFKKIDGDPFVSFLISDSNFESKETLIYFYKTSMVGGTGGGSESGITSGDVQTMIEASLEDYYDIDEIDAALSGKADSSAVTEAITSAVSGKAETSAVTAVNSSLTAHTADTDIHVTSADKTAWNAKSNFSGSYNDLTDKPTIPTVPTSNSAFTNDEGYITEAALEGYAMTSAVSNSISAATDDMATKTWVGEQGYITGVDLSNYATNDDVTSAVSGKADTSAVTAVSSALNNKQDTLVSGTNIKTINNQSLLGNGNITISGGSGGSNAVEVTQAEYDALVSGGTVQSDTFYIITDATTIDISNYYTSAQTESAITAAVSGKADTTAVTASIASAVSGKIDTSAVVTAVTSGSTDAEIPTAKAVYDALQESGGGGVSESAFTSYSAATDARMAEDEEVTAAALNALNDGKQDTLIAGSGITISGNVISAIGGGGGKAINAGRGISVTTGETADTVSFNLPISASTNGYGIILHSGSTASSGAIASGYKAYAALNSIAFGLSSSTHCNSSIAVGEYNDIQRAGYGAFVLGNNNIISNYGIGALGNYLISNASSEVSCGKHNISRGNNFIFGNSGDTLFTVGNGDTNSTRHNALEIRQNGDIYFPDTDNTTYQNFYDKPMVRLQDMYASLGGLKLVKLTQSEYDALSTKDSNTLYVIVN